MKDLLIFTGTIFPISITFYLVGLGVIEGGSLIGNIVAFVSGCVSGIIFSLKH